jgi:hypothetical protein
MTREERDARVKILAPALRKMVREIDWLSDLLWRRLGDHRRAHDCTWLAVNRDITPGPSPPYCPVQQMLMDAWFPVAEMRSSLEWLLLDGPVPANYVRDTAEQAAAEARP